MSNFCRWHLTLKKMIETSNSEWIFILVFFSMKGVMQCSAKQKRREGSFSAWKKKSQVSWFTKYPQRIKNQEKSEFFYYIEEEKNQILRLFCNILRLLLQDFASFSCLNFPNIDEKMWVFFTRTEKKSRFLQLFCANLFQDRRKKNSRILRHFATFVLFLLLMDFFLLLLIEISSLSQLADSLPHKKNPDQPWNSHIWKGKDFSPFLYDLSHSLKRAFDKKVYQIINFTNYGLVEMFATHTCISKVSNFKNIVKNFYLMCKNEADFPQTYFKNRGNFWRALILTTSVWI